MPLLCRRHQLGKNSDGEGSFALGPRNGTNGCTDTPEIDLSHTEIMQGAYPRRVRTPTTERTDIKAIAFQKPGEERRLVVVLMKDKHYG